MNFYYIHNFKTMGTTIFSQLPINYLNKYYGCCSLIEYENKNKIKLNRNNIYSDFANKKISIDHLHINSLIDVGIIKNIENIEFIMFFRNPIDRFISICNYRNIHPLRLIEDLKNKIGDDYFQYKMMNCKYNINLKICNMSDKNYIKRFFNKYNINLDLSIKKNVSKKNFNRSMLSEEDLIFLREHFKKDFEIIHNLEKVNDI